MLQTSLLGALPEGTTLGDRYRIIHLLGQGGMSRVYLAEDTRLGVEVAVKENLQTSPEARRQFEREAHLLARLSHPNLPRVSDHFTNPGTNRQYLVMDYVEGEDLKTLVERTGALPEQTALAWVGQVLDALEYLHRQQPPVIHRDVKPGNIKITPQGKAVLVDFGIAKVGGPALSTLTGARAVTPGYAPPEQYGMRTSERSDIYGVGATLYTLLTGRVPPEAPLRMAGERLIPPRRVVPGISRPTETAVLRAMEMETNRRWDSVSTLRQALRGQPARPSPPREWRRAVPPPEERRKGWLTSSTVPIILAALVTLAVLLAVVLWPRIVSPTPTSTRAVATEAQRTAPATPQVITDPAQLTAFELAIAQYRQAEKAALVTLDPAVVEQLPVFVHGEALAAIVERIESLRAQALYQELTVQQLDVLQVTLWEDQAAEAVVKEQYTLRTYRSGVEGDRGGDENAFDETAVYGLIYVDGRWKVERRHSMESTGP